MAVSMMGLGTLQVLDINSAYINRYSYLPGDVLIKTGKSAFILNKGNFRILCLSHQTIGENNVPAAHEHLQAGAVVAVGALVHSNCSQLQVVLHIHTVFQGSTVRSVGPGSPWLFRWTLSALQGLTAGTNGFSAGGDRLSLLTTASVRRPMKPGAGSRWASAAPCVGCLAASSVFNGSMPISFFLFNFLFTNATVIFG